MVKRYRPAAPFIAPLSGDVDQRLAQLAQAISRKADETSVPTYARVILVAPGGSRWSLVVNDSGVLATEQVTN